MYILQQIPIEKGDGGSDKPVWCKHFSPPINLIDDEYVDNLLSMIRDTGIHFSGSDTQKHLVGHTGL